MSKRPERLQYVGKQGDYILGVPRRNLDERDLRRLSDEQLVEIMTSHPVTGKALYVEPEQKTEEPPSKDESDGGDKTSKKSKGR